MRNLSLLRTSLVWMLVAAPCIHSLHAQGAHSAEIGGSFGWSNITGLDNNHHPAFGATGGFNVINNLQLFGEYLYSPQGSLDGVSAKGQWFGGGARLHFGSSELVRPFVVVAGGHFSSSFDVGGAGIGLGAGYFGLGGGVSIYVHKHLVIRPEARFERLQYGSYNVGGDESVNPSGNTVLFTVSALYQFGGR